MKTDAFTRVELLVVLATIGLLSLIGMSVSANTREGSERMVCMNNLRQIGRAFHVWAAEHGHENGWWVDPSKGGYRFQTASSPVVTMPGVGTFPAAVVNNPWFHYGWVHESLPSPDVLLCPTDPAKKRAASFSTAPGGLAHIGMQNTAVSYLLGLHATRKLPNEMLSADRNMIAQAGPVGCSSGLNGRPLTPPRMGGPPTGWTSGLHASSGNVLLNDGRVEDMTAGDLNAYVNSPPNDDSFNTFHLLIP
jgi:hypothetical protein